MTEHRYGAWRDTATKQDWAKYFRSKNRALYGILGNGEKEYQVNQFAKYELTTKRDHKNTFEDMVKDHKKLLRIFREKRKIDLDYYAIPELSPKNELIHMHGIFRKNEDYELEDGIIEQKELSELWDSIHGAPVVWIAKPYSYEDAIGYMTKHTVKEYPVTSKLGFRVMTSRGWLPDKFELVRKIIYKAGSYKNAHVGGVNEVETWQTVEKSMIRWCKGENTSIMRLSEGEREGFYINGKRIWTLRGDVFDIEEFALLMGIIKSETVNNKK